MFQNENKYNNSIKLINHDNKKSKNNTITYIKYDNQEEFNYLNDFKTLPWTNAQDDFSENNFNLTANIETLNHLNKNENNKKEEEHISPQKLNDDDTEEKINASFNQDINSNSSNDLIKSKKSLLKKKRKNINRDILTPIQEAKFENTIFKSAKTTIQKMELFRIIKLNEFNPLFKGLKQEQENTWKLKKKQIFQEVHHARKKKLKWFKIKKVSISQPQKINDLTISQIEHNFQTHINSFHLAQGEMMSKSSHSQKIK